MSSAEVTQPIPRITFEEPITWDYQPERRRIGPGLRRTAAYGGVALGALGLMDAVSGNAALYHIGELLNNCDPISESRVEAAREQLDEDFKNAPAVDPHKVASPGAIFDDPTVPQLALQHDFILPLDGPFTYEETLNNSWRPWSAVTRVDEYMSRNYGIHVTVEGEPTDSTIKDAADLVARYYPIPPELVRKVTEDDLQTIVLDAQIDDDIAIATYTDSEETVRMRPGATEASAHEFNHGVLVTSSAENCWFKTDERQSNYDLVNPVSFSYGDNNGRWKKVTVSEHAAEGADNPSEDYADTGAMIMGAPFGNIAHCVVSLPSIIKDKVAINLASYDQLVPGSAEYFSEQLAARSNC